MERKYFVIKYITSQKNGGIMSIRKENLETNRKTKKKIYKI